MLRDQIGREREIKIAERESAGHGEKYAPALTIIRL
jgi:hypothetical protein